MGAASPKPPLAIPPRSKLWGFLAFSRETARRFRRRADKFKRYLKDEPYQETEE